MKKTLIHQVTSSIFDVMETMFFFTVEEKKDDTSDLPALLDPKIIRAGRITFSGSFSGAICLLTPFNVLEKMTRNFLGEDDGSLSEEQTDGTLKEALNMIAGNALTQMDKKSYMGLGIPEIIDPAAIKPDNPAVVFNTSDGMMAAIVQLDDQ